MRTYLLLTAVLLSSPFPGFTQEPSLEFKLRNLEGSTADSLMGPPDNRTTEPQEDTLTGPGDSGTMEPREDTLTGPGDSGTMEPREDTLTAPGGYGFGEYLADTIPVAEFDTSYFSAGDPEYNLIRAAEFGQAEVVKMLVERGVDVDARTYEGVTPLMYASQNGDTAIMAFLVARGADVNAKPSNGVTPLIGATRRDNYDAVRMLLESGAKVDEKDEFDLTPLMHASAYNYPEIVALLIRAGADTEAGDWFGTRPLMMAAFYNCLEAADVLLRMGADPNGRDEDGYTPLMIAVQHGDYDMAWLLLDKGADPKIRNIGGHHALSIAVMKKDEDLVELLLESGASVNQNINPATSPLDLAEESGNESMVEFLISNGARHNRRPEISEIRGGMTLNFNGDDFMMGWEAGITENKYKTYLTTGFMSRLSPIRVLRPENDTLSFQLWERRYVWPLTMGKNLTITTQEKNTFGVRFHFSGALTWGNNRGSDLRPGLRFLFIPGAGLFWRQQYFGLSFDYQYVPFKIYDVSSHRFVLSFLGFYDFRSRIRYIRKDIRWF